MLVSSDRFLVKILDRTVSIQDIAYQLRNVKGLNCVYDDSFVVQYFGKGFIQSLSTFVEKFPEADDEVRRYMHSNEENLKNIRFLFKLLRYSEDQKTEVSSKLAKLIRDSAKENKCNTEILYKDSLKTNFISLIELELYLRARYGSQIKANQKFDTIKPSIDLFVESLDKQFTHEYYW